MTAPFSTAQLDALNAVNGEAAAEIMRLRSELHAANMRLSDVTSDRDTWKDRALGVVSMLPGSMICGDVQEAARVAEAERVYAIACREALETIRDRSRNGPDMDSMGSIHSLACAALGGVDPTLDTPRTVGKRNDNPGWATILPGSER